MIVQKSRIRNDYQQPMIINPNEKFIYRPTNNYQVTSPTYRTYIRPATPKYRYAVDQGGKSYRCCECCRNWCTQKCPTCDFCDRILACPLLFFILSGLFLLLLFVALLTLFGLHPNINPSQRYYGVVSKLSIYNRTKYIYNLDALCSSTSAVNNCLNIVTSTGYSILSTTIILNQATQSTTYSSVLLMFCLVVHLKFEKKWF